MGRTKKIIASLLPVFWLVALVHGPVQSSALALPHGECVPSSSAEGATPLTEHSCGSLDQVARCELRRHSVERPAVTLRHLEPVTSSQSISLHSSALPIPLAGEAILLQQRWQFVWRTADSPRAPSLLA